MSFSSRRGRNKEANKKALTQGEGAIYFVKKYNVNVKEAMCLITF
jgi:hypothetical protein